MSILDRRTICVLSTVLVFAAVGAFVYAGRKTIIAFLFAIFFAYLLEPAVSLVQRWRRVTRGSRARSILIVYILLGIIVSGLFFVVGPRLVAEGKMHSGALPGLLDRVASGQIVHQIGAKRGWSYSTEQKAQEFLAQHRGDILRWAQQL